MVDARSRGKISAVQFRESGNQLHFKLVDLTTLQARAGAKQPYNVVKQRSSARQHCKLNLTSHLRWQGKQTCFGGRVKQPKWYLKVRKVVRTKLLGTRCAAACGIG